MQKEYWFVLAVQPAYLLDHLFCSIAIGCVKDLTFEFNWIQNGTDIVNGTAILANGTVVALEDLK